MCQPGLGSSEAPLGLEDQAPGGPLPGLVGGCWPAVGVGGLHFSAEGQLEGPQDMAASSPQTREPRGRKAESLTRTFLQCRNLATVIGARPGPVRDRWHLAHTPGGGTLGARSLGVWLPAGTP